MYLPSIFEEKDRQLVVRVMRENAFATIITHGDGIHVSHVPTLVEDHAAALAVQFHLAVQNPQCRQLRDSLECLIAFTGPNCYVSPSWYSQHPSVPTWNYLSVHVTGGVRVLSREETEAQLAELSRRHEAAVGGAWRFDDLPREYMEKLLNGIVGFSLSVARLEAKSKLSQNRPAIDRENVTQKLMDSPDPSSRAVARWMVEKSESSASP